MIACFAIHTPMSNRQFWYWLCLLAAPLGTAAAQVPTAAVAHQSQLWLGYLTSQRLTDRFSLWNDFHFVPQGFYVLRTGLTLHHRERISLTGGYAYLGLPAGLTRDLKRPEHRPWGQVVATAPLLGDWHWLFRLRYDARFRRRIAQGELLPGYGFNHRIRLLTQFRRDFPQWTFTQDVVPFAAISNEVLLNAGREIVYNQLDQNRFTVAIGARRRGLQVQTGYMHRFVQLPAGDQQVVNHTLVVWMFHVMDFRP